VLVVDRPCALELFHVSTEEPTSDSPPLELWECAKGHRMHLASKKEESRSKLKIKGEASEMLSVEGNFSDWWCSSSRLHLTVDG